MSRYLGSGVVIGGLMLFACTTEPCACPPTQTWVVVKGSLRQENQTPVGGVTVWFGEHRVGSCAPSADVDEDLAVLYGTVDTDGNGLFQTELYSLHGLGERCLILTAVAGTDSARAWQLARFRKEGELPDTVQASLVLREP